jgi:hypothetical protein
MVLTISTRVDRQPGVRDQRFGVARLGCQRVGDRLRPRRSAGVGQVGANATARRLVSALVNETAHGQ